MVLNIGSKGSDKKEKDKFIKNLEEVNRIKSRVKSDKPIIVIEFSWQVLLALALILSLIFWGKELVTIFIFLFVALVIMSSAKPIVLWMMKRGLPKGWAVTITYLVGFGLLSGLISAVIVPVVNQLGTLNETLPLLVEKFVSEFNGFSIGSYTLDTTTITEMTADFLRNLSVSDSFASLAGTLGSVFNLSTMFLAAVVFSIYMLLDHDSLLDLGLIQITSDTKRERVKKLVLDVEYKLGSWLLGQATVSLLAGLVMGIVLTAFGVPFVLPLAVFVALMDTVPGVGAIIASIPVALVALLSGGPIVAILVLVIFTAYQQIENTFVIPRIMSTAVGIRPIAVLVTAVSFLTLFGVWGAILAVPALVIFLILYEFYIDLQKLEAKGSI